MPEADAMMTPRLVACGGDHRREHPGEAMPEFLNDLLSADGFLPHGHCYLWRPGLVWLHVVSDALITLAYTSIPFTLLYFVRRRRDLPFHWMFLCFGTFIIACGATHALDIWTLWTPTYWLSGVVKAVTAAASVPTALLLAKLVPQALAIPTPQQLANARDELQRAIDALERRVEERTAELTRKNAELAREIVERKRVEDALIKSEGQLRRLSDAGILGIVTSDRDGTVLSANRAFLDIIGYTADDLAAGKIRRSELTPPELHALDERAFEQLRTAGVASPWEKQYIHKDGHRVSVLVGAAIDTASGERVAFVLDLSERKRAEEAIRRLEKEREADAKLGAMLEAAPDAMVIVDPDGRIVLVNAETERLFGYTRDQLLDQPVDLLVPERLRAPHAHHRAGYATSPTGRRAMGAGQQLVGLRRDGTEFPAEIRLSPIPTRDGLLVSSAIRDVTERNAAEQALRAAKDGAEAAYADLEAFSYSVAHDLRAPLRAMSGYSTLLVEDYGDKLDGDGRDRLGRVVDAARRMSEIIDALLSLARLSRTEPRRERVDLTRLAHAVVEQLRAGDPHRAVDFVAADDLVVQGDPELLRLVLDNLLGNAWKFTARQPAARVELGRDDTSGTATYFVRDNGAGFDMALADKLFAPFKRLHTAAEFAGTGIGLATVQRIVRRHGGRIWAEGAQARGATFHFTLPSGPRPRSSTGAPAGALTGILTGAPTP
jgi:PAS domain S-box-containing protein